jgi:hypothetical protein
VKLTWSTSSQAVWAPATPAAFLKHIQQLTVQEEFNMVGHETLECFSQGKVKVKSRSRTKTVLMFLKYGILFLFHLDF